MNSFIYIVHHLSLIIYLVVKLSVVCLDLITNYVELLNNNASSQQPQTMASVSCLLLDTQFF